MNTALYGPILSLMLLTMTVWFWMYIKRISYMKQNDIDPQRLVSRVRLMQVLPDEIQAPANNLNNLFELPLLFYALYLLNSQQASIGPILTNLAWAYVFLRVIHCSYNKVLHRFTAYSLSCLVLWAMLMLTIFRFV